MEKPSEVTKRTFGQFFETQSLAGYSLQEFDKIRRKLSKENQETCWNVLLEKYNHIYRINFQGTIKRTVEINL